MSDVNDPSPSGKNRNLCPAPEGAKPPSGTRQIAVSTILRAEREVFLIHNGEAYRLRITANNKLILTK